MVQKEPKRSPCDEEIILGGVPENVGEMTNEIVLSLLKETKSLAPKTDKQVSRSVAEVMVRHGVDPRDKARIDEVLGKLSACFSEKRQEWEKIASYLNEAAMESFDRKMSMLESKK